MLACLRTPQATSRAEQAGVGKGVPICDWTGQQKSGCGRALGSQQRVDFIQIQ